jgi:hypothetical protein
MSFQKILVIDLIWNKILSFQDGKTYKEWIDGDKAIKLGYRFIINTNKNLQYSNKSIPLLLYYDMSDLIPIISKNNNLTISNIDEAYVTLNLYNQPQIALKNMQYLYKNGYKFTLGNIVHIFWHNMHNIIIWMESIPEIKENIIYMCKNKYNCELQTVMSEYINNFIHFPLSFEIKTYPALINF